MFTAHGMGPGERHCPGATRSCHSPAACVPHPAARSQGVCATWPRPRAEGHSFWASWEKGLENSQPTSFAFVTFLCLLSHFETFEWKCVQFEANSLWTFSWWIMFIFEQHRFSFFKTGTLQDWKSVCSVLENAFNMPKVEVIVKRAVHLTGQQKLSIHTHIYAIDKTYIMHIYMY